MKLCVNCKHCLPSEALTQDPEYSRCGFERPISPVTGRLRPIPDLTYCSTQRSRTGACGLEANNWQAAYDVMTPEEEEEMLKEAKYV